jgi:hypothetical protein
MIFQNKNVTFVSFRCVGVAEMLGEQGKEQEEKVRKGTRRRRRRRPVLYRWSRSEIVIVALRAETSCAGVV